MNDTITAQTQMQKGFKTFILTLSVSLIIFSVIYYFISDKQSSSDLNSTFDESMTTEIESAVVTDAAMVIEDQNQSPITEVENVVEQNIVEEDVKEDTVFGKLASAAVIDTSRAVLAGTTTSPTGTGSTAARVVKTSTVAVVPSGGVTELTWGFFISLISFALGFIVISKDPRKMAIQHFEKKMLK